MTLYINGVPIGEITDFSESNENYVARPQSPSFTLIPAYFTGRGHDVIKLTVKTPNKVSFFSYKRIIKSLMDSNEVLYFADSTFKLYNSNNGFWGVISSFESSLNARDLGSFSFEIVVTTDRTDSGYHS